jgi:DNA-binding CsgD family transcriptional regulator
MDSSEFDHFNEELQIDFFDRIDEINFRDSLDKTILQKMRGFVAEQVLSRREAEILTLRAFGLTNTQISEFLNLKKRNVDNRVTGIKIKLQSYLGLGFKEALSPEELLTKILSNWAFEDKSKS